MKLRKGICFLLVLLLISACLVSCKKEEPTETGEEVDLSYSEYDLSEYLELGDFTAPKASFADPSVCTEEEIDTAIFQIMLSYAAFTEREGRSIELYDKVQIDYVGMIDGEAVEDLTDTGHEFVIGSNNLSDIEKIFQNSLIGKTAGEIVTAEYAYPDDAFNYGFLAGKTVNFSAEILKVYEPDIPECNDEFVAGMDGDFGFTTVADFRDALRTDILEQKQNDKISAVWNAFFEETVVKKYPEKEVNHYYDEYLAYFQAYADEMEMDLESFVSSQLGFSLEELKQEAKSYAEYMVKTDMTFVLLAQKMEIEISDEEYQTGIEEYWGNESASFSTLEEFEEYYGKEELRRNLIWDKAIQTLSERAVMTEE